MGLDDGGGCTSGAAARFQTMLDALDPAQLELMLVAIEAALAGAPVRAAFDGGALTVAIGAGAPPVLIEDDRPGSAAGPSSPCPPPSRSTEAGAVPAGPPAPAVAPAVEPQNDCEAHLIRSGFTQTDLDMLSLGLDRHSPDFIQAELGLTPAAMLAARKRLTKNGLFSAALVRASMRRLMEAGHALAR
jgi:hypothetical protein